MAQPAAHCFSRQLKNLVVPDTTIFATGRSKMSPPISYLLSAQMGSHSLMTTGTVSRTPRAPDRLAFYLLETASPASPAPLAPPGSSPLQYVPMTSNEIRASFLTY